MYTLINGSPKIRGSNSSYFLNKITSKLDNYKLFELKNEHGEYRNIIDNIDESSVIVFAFPLYVDSPTSITLDFLDYIVDNNIKLEGKKVYVIINCGFREGEQNITAINIIKRWCEKVDAIYGCSLLIGAGEVVGKKNYKFISHSALKQLDEFAKIIGEQRIESDVITTMDLLNDKMYCFFANMSWSKNGKKNNLSSSDLRIK